MTLDPGLLAAVLESPDDDLPRLLAADWFQENGEWERVEFIRVQIELARMPVVYHNQSLGMAPSRRQVLEARERELLLETAGPCRLSDWPDELRPAVGYDDTDPLTFYRTDYAGSAKIAFQFARGFARTIRCTAAEWQRESNRVLDEIRTGLPYSGPETIGQAILREHSVERVELTDANATLRIWKQTSNISLAPWRLSIDGSDGLGWLDRAALIDAMPQQFSEWRIGLADPRLTAQPAMRWIG